MVKPLVWRISTIAEATPVARTLVIFVHCTRVANREDSDVRVEGVQSSRVTRIVVLFYFILFYLSRFTNAY